MRRPPRPAPPCGLICYRLAAVIVCAFVRVSRGLAPSARPGERRGRDRAGWLQRQLLPHHFAGDQRTQRYLRGKAPSPRARAIRGPGPTASVPLQNSIGRRWQRFFPAVGRRRVCFVLPRKPVVCSDCRWWTSFAASMPTHSSCRDSPTRSIGGKHQPPSLPPSRLSRAPQGNRLEGCQVGSARFLTAG